MNFMSIGSKAPTYGIPLVSVIIFWITTGSRNDIARPNAYVVTSESLWLMSFAQSFQLASVVLEFRGYHCCRWMEHSIATGPMSRSYPEVPRGAESPRMIVPAATGE